MNDIQSCRAKSLNLDHQHEVHPSKVARSIADRHPANLQATSKSDIGMLILHRQRAQRHKTRSSGTIHQDGN